MTSTRINDLREKQGCYKTNVRVVVLGLVVFVLSSCSVGVMVRLGRRLETLLLVPTRITPSPLALLSTTTTTTNKVVPTRSSVVIPERVRHPHLHPVALRMSLTNDNTRVATPTTVHSKQCLERRNQLKDTCRHASCQGHEREVVRTSTTTTTTTTKTTTSAQQHKTKCKTLWFSGFYEGAMSKCDKNGYRMDYSIALNSAIAMASDTLQPVLMLGRYGLQHNESISPLRDYALQRGVILIYVHELTFQNDVLRWTRGYQRNVDLITGVYLRFDIPTFVREHGLFDLPGICQDHVLYTDADVLFANPITHDDLEGLGRDMVQYRPRTGLSSTRYRHDREAFVMYGRESAINNPEPINTGVMFLNVSGMRNFLPQWVRWVNQDPVVQTFKPSNQGRLNNYMKTHQGSALLPLYWNWKLYWRLAPSLLSDLKIVHFHGPKPSNGLWKADECDTNQTGLAKGYHELVLASICCDRLAQTTHHFRNLYHQYAPYPQEVC